MDESLPRARHLSSAYPCQGCGMKAVTYGGQPIQHNEPECMETNGIYLAWWPLPNREDSEALERWLADH